MQSVKKILCFFLGHAFREHLGTDDRICLNCGGNEWDAPLSIPERWRDGMVDLSYFMRRNIYSKCFYCRKPEKILRRAVGDHKNCDNPNLPF